MPEASAQVVFASEGTRWRPLWPWRLRPCGGVRSPGGRRAYQRPEMPSSILEEGLRETGEPPERPPGPEERAWAGIVMTTPGRTGWGILVQKGPCPLEEGLRFTNEETEAEGGRWVGKIEPQVTACSRSPISHRFPSSSFGGLFLSAPSSLPPELQWRDKRGPGHRRKPTTLLLSAERS